MIKRNLLTLILSLFLMNFAPAAFSEQSVNINTASVQELSQLSGIGLNKAKAIVEYRKKHGKFKSADGLQAVSGIGSATVKKNRKKITLK